MTKEVAVAKESSVPAHLMNDLDADAGRGVSQNANDVGIPFLSILQDLSPQVKKRDEAYIDGAEVGMLLNSQLKRVYSGSEGIIFIPCFFRSAMVEWKPNRGGWAGDHPMDTPLAGQVRIGDKGERFLPSGNTLDETKYYYGFYYDPVDQSWEAAVVGMSKSMLKCSREWQGLLKRTKTPGGLVAPSFAKKYLLKSTLVKKDNNEWFIWTIEPLDWVSAEEYAAARELAQQCENGMVRAAVPDEEAVTGGADSGVVEEVL